MLTYVLGTLRKFGCFMKIKHTVKFPKMPKTKMMENNIGTKYVSIRFAYDT